MRKWLTIGALVALSACAKDGTVGPTGPQGPTGATGAVGPQGPVGAQGTTKLTYTGTANSSGAGFADLPAAAGTLASPPIYSCYLLYSIGGASVWLPTGDALGSTAVTCALGNTPGLSSLRVLVAGAVTGQSMTILVVY